MKVNALHSTWSIEDFNVGKYDGKMKKSILFLLLNFLVVSIFAQEWVNLGSLNPSQPQVVLRSADQKSTTVEFSLNGYSMNKVSTPQGLQSVISVPEMASMLEEGSPDLPLFAIPILIDDKAEMRLVVNDVQYVDVQDVEIAPSKGNLSRQIDPDDVPYCYGEAYRRDAFFPDCQARLDQPYIYRDFRGQNILVYPFAYNPIQKTLRVFTHLTLTVQQGEGQGDNPKLRSRSSVRLSPEMQAQYARRFVNFGANAAKYTFVPDEGEMMVICPEQYMPAMQPLVDWKNASGRPTTMYSLTEVGGNDANLIKSFILSHYNNPDENLCYVLLVGDYDDLTPYPLGGGRSDIWFGQLEGNDYYPEVLVGRFSVESVADVENQVTKVIYYERDMPITAAWLSHGIGIGSTEGAGIGHNGGESDYQHLEYIRDTLLHYTYTEVSQHYAGVGAGTNAAMLSADFNEGVGICNYCNHGSQTLWSVGTFTNSHINALVNDYKWPFIWSTACLNGDFNYTQPCFAEAWMRATNNTTGAPTGAIGGMFSWTSQPWQPPMTGQDEMVDILCEWRSADQFHHTLGGASLNGNMKILDLHPTDQGATHNTWILFGDPSLMLRTAQPEPMNVVCQPEAIFLGQTELRLSADADYALATLTVDGSVLCSAPIVNGEGVLAFESLEHEGTAQLVVMGFNKVTEVKNIEIIPADGAYLTFDSFAVNDANGQADYGETVNIDMTVKNIGNQNASDVQLVLTTDSPFVQIVDGTAHISNIDAMDSYTIANAFQIAVDAEIEDGAQVGFNLVCSDGSHSWSSQFRMTLHAPVFVLTEFRPVSTAYPGLTDTLLVGFGNVGSSDAHEARVMLFSSASDLSFTPMLYNIGDLPSGGQITVKAPFHASSSIPVGSSFEVYYLFDAEPFAFSGIETLNIGPLRETFESGDFSLFDWQTLGGAHWFVDNSTANTGAYSARTGAISHTNLTTLQVEIEVPHDGQISFYKKTETEGNKDILTFYIDNTAMGEWSGDVGWSREAFNVTAGTHRFKWIYMKNGSGSYGADACWIDDVQFPSANTVELLPQFEVEANLDLNEVTLSWPIQGSDCDYMIRCNGYLLTTQYETSFTHLQNLGSYIYSVVAVNSDGHLSMPALAKVDVTMMGVEENEGQLKMFPNPVSDVLQVELGQPFNYFIVNAIGQQVMRGESPGKAHIRCEGLSKGVYLLRIVTENRTVVKKIVVQ